jgi:hypothetical protein
MRQHRIPRFLSLTVAGSGLLVLGMLPAPASADAPASAGRSLSVGTQTGQVGVANRVAHHRTTTRSGPAASAARQHGSRRLPSSRAALSRAAAALAPTASPAGPSDAASQLLNSFDGTSSRDSEVTNFNLRFEPPDQGLCAGAGFVLEPVNSAYRIFRRDGQTIRGPFNVNDLFNEGAKEFTTDPRCWYDPTTHAWFAVVAFLNDTFTEGRIDIAVNPNRDPTGLWTEYQIDATFDGRNGEPNKAGCPCFGDQPRLGIDQYNLYVTTDEFSINGPQFYGGQIYAISKAQLVRGVAHPHFVRFGNLHLGGKVTGAPQPADSIGQPKAEYFLSQLDNTGAGDHRIGVWAMTERRKVASGVSPKLSQVVINSLPYSSPPRASQLGSTSRLDSGDDRMQQASYVNGTVWGELGTRVRPTGDNLERPGIAWFQIRPHRAHGRIVDATIVRQAYVAQRGEGLLYPALQPDAHGNAAMVFTRTGKNRYPSAAYTVLHGGARNFSPSVIAAAGHGPYDADATRWGDYSYAVPDWGHAAAWLATEYIPPASSQTSTRERNWGTRVIRVALR